MQYKRSSNALISLFSQKGLRQVENNRFFYPLLVIKLFNLMTTPYAPYQDEKKRLKSVTYLI